MMTRELFYRLDFARNFYRLFSIIGAKQMDKFTGTIRAGFGLRATGPLSIGYQSAVLPFPIEVGISSGNGPGQCDQAWWERRTVGGEAVDSIDLAGTLVDPFGQTVTFAVVCGIWVRASDANAGPIIIGGAAANPFIGPFGADGSSTVTLAPGESFLVTNLQEGWPVTAATADILAIENEDEGPSIYDIAVIGRAAA